MAIKKDFAIAIHPGEILQEELEARGLSQTALAQHLDIHQSKINEICKGRRGISPEMAVQLGRAFGNSPQFWLNLQTNWELSKVDQALFEEIEELAA